MTLVKLSNINCVLINRCSSTFNFKWSKLNYTSCQSLDCLFAKVLMQNKGQVNFKTEHFFRTDINLWQNSLLTSSHARIFVWIRDKPFSL